MEKIIILGTGGHAGSLTDIVECVGKYKIAGYVDNNKSETLNEGKYHIIGSDDDLENIYKSGIYNAALGIGFLGKSDIRKKLYKRLKDIGYYIPIIEDPSAILSKYIDIEEGVFIGKGAIVNCYVTIKKGSIINSGAIVEHNCKIGEFSHISVGSILCGNVTIGSSSFIGANATIIQGVSIGNYCIIGAGTTVTKNVEDYYMVYKNHKKYLGGGMRNHKKYLREGGVRHENRVFCRWTMGA